MVNLFLLYFFVGLPFVPGPISKHGFPSVIESSLDHSDIQAIASYRWNGEKEMVEYSGLTPSDFQKSRYLLDESNLVKQRIRYLENSDSVYFTETYSTQAGRISTWTGSFEAASCFYKAEMLDSVYLVNTDHENSEIYSYKFKYDSANRLVQLDKRSIVPNNNPGPDKRSVFQYSSGDSILPTFLDPKVRFLDLARAFYKQ